MKKLEFKPGMFNGLAQCYDANQLAAEFAQAKFDDWYRENIESAPLVYGSVKDISIVQLFGQVPGYNDTHTARLIDIQEIKKECKHDRKAYGYKEAAPHAACMDCGVELYAEWKVKP